LATAATYLLSFYYKYLTELGDQVTKFFSSPISTRRRNSSPTVAKTAGKTLISPCQTALLRERQGIRLLSTNRSKKQGFLHPKTLCPAQAVYR
jgi:hypothetical protein